MNTQRKIPFSPPDVTIEEANEVRDALLSGWITTGPRTKELERQIAEMCHTRKAVCLSSCTSSMIMALRLIGVTSEDEVIIPAYTYTATASSVLHLGARLKMVDVQPGTCEMDYEKLAEAITERTKVVMIVEIAGIICNYDKIYEVLNRPEIISKFNPRTNLQKHIGRITVLSDSAHAFGSQWHGKMAGEIADFTAFSFHAVKNFTTAEGGALTWNLPFGSRIKTTSDPKNLDLGLVPTKENETWDECIYRILQLLSLHGQSKDALAKTQLGAWEYDVIGAYYKCNMTDLSAAIGLVQMKRYPQMLARRREVISYYNERLKGLNVQVLCHSSEEHQSNGHLYIVRLLGKDAEYRNQVIIKMAERGIATNVHFKPLPLMTAYKGIGFDIEDYPQSYDFYQNAITLPLYSKLTDEDIEYVMDGFIEVLNEMESK